MLMERDSSIKKEFEEKERLEASLSRFMSDIDQSKEVGEEEEEEEKGVDEALISRPELLREDVAQKLEVTTASLMLRTSLRLSLRFIL